MIGRSFFYGSAARLASNLVISAVPKDSKTSPVVSFSKYVITCVVGLVIKDFGGPGDNAGGFFISSDVGERVVTSLSGDILNELDM